MHKCKCIHFINYEALLSPDTKVDKLLFELKSSGIDIGNTGPVFTWYQIDTKFCSIAHP